MSLINSENLLFLISQPRSGSSLLQQVLMTKNEIISFPEPWIMLALIHVYKRTNITDGYNPKYTSINLDNYLNNFSESKTYLKSNIKEIALGLYNLNKLEEGQKYFLDKTPRYYHILPELTELFPDAKFLILTRNPAAVFSSILYYNYNGNISGIFENDRLDDLFKAPRIISEMKRIRGQHDNLFFVKYEDLVNDPIIVMNRISGHLGIEGYRENEIKYHVDDSFRRSNAIDRKSLLNNSIVVRDYLDSWKRIIDNTQKKKLLLDYLELLGEEVFHNLGYDYNMTVNSIRTHKVKYRIPMQWKYFENKGREMTIYEHIYYCLANRINRYISRLPGQA